MVSLRLPLALLAAVVLAAPAGAAAQETNAPPGNSGIDEYLETVPKAGGSQPPRRPGQGPSALSPGQRKRLERLGRDGRLLADVVKATAPRTADQGDGSRTADQGDGSRTADQGDGSRSETQLLPEANGRSPLGKAFEAVGGNDDGDGLGVLLPAILLATLLGTLALVLVRRRSAS